MLWNQGTTQRLVFTPDPAVENLEHAEVTLAFALSKRSPEPIFEITEADSEVTRTAEDITVIVPAAETADLRAGYYYVEMRVTSADPVYSVTPVAEEVELVRTLT